MLFLQDHELDVAATCGNLYPGGISEIEYLGDRGVLVPIFRDEYLQGSDVLVLLGVQVELSHEGHRLQFEQDVDRRHCEVC